MSTYHTELCNKRILVTGATGFIGSHLVRRLVAEKAEVYAILRATSDMWRIQDCVDQIHIRECDITDREAMIRVVQETQPQKVFHLAAYVSHPDDDLFNNVTINFVASLYLMEALKPINLECFVYFGTGHEYGGTLSDPISEEQHLHPYNLYSASKSATCLFCQVFHECDGFPVIIVRPFATYGPFESSTRLIPNTILSALRGQELLMTEGEQKRDYLFISDLIEGILRAATLPQAVGKIFNLASGRSHSVRQLVTKCLELMGHPIEPRFGALPYRSNEMWELRADITKAQSILQWVPTISLAEGLEQTVEWYRQNLHRFE